MKKISILGTRGVPAAHGGFETFAGRLAPYLIEHGWQVTVYCQEDGEGSIHEDEWQGVRRVHIPVSRAGAAGTMQFDWASITHLLSGPEPGLALTLGYNTALFCARLRMRGIPNLINMDGLEWKRDKWSFPAKAWLWLNERAGCLLGNHLFADHPEIENHLATRVSRAKITMIPYGADLVNQADIAVLSRYGLEAGKFAVVIARPEPENSILEIVRAFSARPRGMTLAVLGRYSEQMQFQAEVVRSASAEVKFLGAIYEPDVVAALRYYSLAYVHGHRVGGTNPSLVEALGAGCPVLAHDNPFNRWVAGTDAWYFGDEPECAVMFDRLAGASSVELNSMRESSRRRRLEAFTWELVLAQYESILARWAE